jgi:transposase
MRGAFSDQAGMFSYISPEARIPADHPLRAIRAIVREVLRRMSPTFARLYAHEGRPSIPPEQLFSTLLLQALYGVRSERLLMEQLDYNLLFRWFVGLAPDDKVWHPTVFSKNRDRLLDGDVFAKFLAKLLAHPKVAPLLSDEHFSVDGTLIEAWAGHKSFKPKDGSDDDGENFRGQKRMNDTHESTTDPEAKLYRKAKGKEAKLSYLGHALMENRHGLAVDGKVTQANGTAERRTAEAMLKKKARRKRRISVGADKGYDEVGHVAALRAMNVIPHVAQINDGGPRTSAIDARTTRHESYAASQICRKAVECIFGWGKQHGTMRKPKHRGTARVEADFLLNLIGYNLVRLPKLIAA